MLRDSTYEEFARWLEHLMSMVPSPSVVTPLAASQKKERTWLAMKRAHLLQPIRAADGINRDMHQEKQAIVHNIRSGFEPAGDESHVWDD